MFAGLQIYARTYSNVACHLHLTQEGGPKPQFTMTTPLNEDKIVISIILTE